MTEDWLPVAWNENPRSEKGSETGNTFLVAVIDENEANKEVDGFSLHIYFDDTKDRYFPIKRRMIRSILSIDCIVLIYKLVGWKHDSIHFICLST